jgi:hypothetical protein
MVTGADDITARVWDATRMGEEVFVAIHYLFWGRLLSRRSGPQDDGPR